MLNRITQLPSYPRCQDLQHRQDGAQSFRLCDLIVHTYVDRLAREVPNPPKSFQGLLAIAQPNMPGHTCLLNAAKELVDIQQLKPSNFPVHNLCKELATTESVVKDLGERSCVHLTCHAIQNASDPNQSGFYLHDGRLTLSKIITHSFRHADFAFLSACQTAKGDDTLSEEAAHLAGAMVTAGYRSVIATMWSIKDDYAPLVANEVYSRLVCGSSPDSTRAAHALHHAVKALRDQLGESTESSFLLWVPFIHVGV